MVLKRSPRGGAASYVRLSGHQWVQPAYLLWTRYRDFVHDLHARFASDRFTAGVPSRRHFATLGSVSV
jgi:hypothetical protein